MPDIRPTLQRWIKTAWDKTHFFSMNVAAPVFVLLFAVSPGDEHWALLWALLWVNYKFRQVRELFIERVEQKDRKDLQQRMEDLRKNSW